MAWGYTSLKGSLQVSFSLTMTILATQKKSMSWVEQQGSWVEHS